MVVLLVDNLLSSVSPAPEVDADAIWKACIALLHQSGALTPGTFSLLSSSRVVGFRDGELSVALPHGFHAQWIETHHMSNVLKALEEVAGEPFRVRFTAEDEPAHDTPPLPEPIPTRPIGSFALNQTFTFDNFIVGKSNELAHAASLTVAKHPGSYYNPLFIYGGTGLGKTHLLHSIAHVLLNNFPGASATYVSSEDFTNDLISAIFKNKPHKFREKYRTPKLLLIDDIHFIADKERTQEEFFHTFNALHRKGSQIVITSDRPPHETNLEHRLVSRFESGLIADIQAPDYETRLAILQKKAGILELSIPDDVLMFIASNVKRNVRQLEGCLVRLSAHSALHKKIDLSLAHRILADIIPKRSSVVSVEEIVRSTAQLLGVSPGSLTSRRRTAQVARARHVAMYLARQLTSLSTTDIGNYFGGRDHSTVIHAVRQITRLMESDSDFASMLSSLTQRLTA